MNATQLLREQLEQAHAFLDGSVADVTDDQAQWQPTGIANPLGATYAHVLTGEDLFVAMLGGREPLFATEWSARVGLSELPPMAAPGELPPLDSAWQEWGRGVRVDMPALRGYGQAVQQAADEYLASLSDDALERPLDASAAGIGQPTLGWILSAGLVGHVLSHWGEIACLKGMQGNKGFPL